jgi:hypothetical protein
MVEHLNSCIMSAQEFKFFVSEISFKFIYLLFFDALSQNYCNKSANKAGLL